MPKSKTAALAIRFQKQNGGGRAVANLKRDFPKAAANRVRQSK